MIGIEETRIWHCF